MVSVECSTGPCDQSQAAAPVLAKTGMFSMGQGWSRKSFGLPIPGTQGIIATEANGATGVFKRSNLLAGGA